MFDILPQRDPIFVWLLSRYLVRFDYYGCYIDCYCYYCSIELLWMVTRTGIGNDVLSMKRWLWCLFGKWCVDNVADGSLVMKRLLMMQMNWMWWIVWQSLPWRSQTTSIYGNVWFAVITSTTHEIHQTLAKFCFNFASAWKISKNWIEKIKQQTKSISFVSSILFSISFWQFLGTLFYSVFFFNCCRRQTHTITFWKNKILFYIVSVYLNNALVLFFDKQFFVFVLFLNWVTSDLLFFQFVFQYTNKTKHTIKMLIKFSN